jgi:hypothetical protein
MKWSFLLATALPFLQARASVVTYGFAGQLDQPFGTLPAGTPFYGEFAYEENQTDNQATPPGDYVCLNMSLSIGGGPLTSIGPGGIGVWDQSIGFSMDVMIIGSTTFTGPVGGLLLQPNGGVSIRLMDEGSLWDSVALPGPGLIREDFDLSANLTLVSEGVGPDVQSATGDLAVLVPEPSWALFSAAGVLFLRRRK